MNGNKMYLLDTNAIVALLKGNEYLVKLCNNADFISISVLSQIEFMSYKNLSENDKNLFETFKQNIDVIDLEADNISLIETIYKLKKTTNLKLPDAIIAASALITNSIFVTADKDFTNITDLQIEVFNNKAI